MKARRKRVSAMTLSEALRGLRAVPEFPLSIYLSRKHVTLPVICSKNLSTRRYREAVDNRPKGEFEY
jgi:hypothetical protein